MLKLADKYGTAASAILLSVLTLAVFALSRDNGPESTVRRFHQAVASGDMIAVHKEMSDASRESGKALRQSVRNALAQGASVQLGKVYIDGRLAYVDVMYVMNGNQVVAILRYVVKKSDLRWQIDAGETNALRRQMFEFS